MLLFLKRSEIEAPGCACFCGVRFFVGSGIEHSIGRAKVTVERHVVLGGNGRRRRH
jgi:hypothetical protein